MSGNLNKGLFTSNSDEWETPQELFDQLNEEFHFDLDICASDENHKCDRYYTKEQDGLAMQDEWSGMVWCNPPYGRQIKKWVKACAEYGNAVMLIPARTDTSWFHDYIWGKSEIRFIRRRLRFGNSKTDAPFPSMIVIFKGGNSD